MNKETRNITVEIKSGEDTRTVEGYAIRFNEESQDLGFYETIDACAITQDTINNSDIFALLNHNENDVLARCNKGVGSLQLELRNDGLYYSFEAPHTAKGDELLEHIKRGEINTSSFAFSISAEDGAEKWYRDSENNLKRTIYKIYRLYDISPVYSAAYPTTSCSARGEEMVKNAEQYKAHNEELRIKINDLCKDE